MSSQRLSGLAKPGVYVMAAYLLALFFRHAASAWHAAAPRPRTLAGALATLVTVIGLRAALPFYELHKPTLRKDIHDQAKDMEPLVAWAREQAAQGRPDAYGRLLVDPGMNAMFHLTAEANLPVVYVGVVPAMLGRERIEAMDAESLRRFNVRWVLAEDHAPLFGEPATEKVIGPYRIRELPTWDGRFARVEQGSGEAVTTRLEDELVEVDLRGTDQPALVALGTGYYPRWRARHESGRVIPVYSIPSRKGATLRVPAAWLPPGKTIFTPDGPLPSDGDGRLLAGLALACALGVIVVWSWPRQRARLLRFTAHLHRRWQRWRPRWLVPAAIVLVGLLVGAGAVRAWFRPALAYRLGTGLFDDSIVEARLKDGEWERCHYQLLSGFYRCGELGKVLDTSGTLLNDTVPSWGFATPVVRFKRERRPKQVLPTAERDAPLLPVEFRIQTRLRLSGKYLAVGKGPPLKLEISGRAPQNVTKQVPIEIDGHRRRRTVVTALVSDALEFALVSEDALQPDRSYLRDPPAAPP